jgi:succinoglycan biosynthesis protein ExoW
MPATDLKPSYPIAIAIPFFQRREGILRRTLDGVVSQTVALRPLIVIVSDGSPVPPEGEIPDALRARADIRIIHQPNGGASAARNRALEEIGDSAAAIALLDSDDTWTPEHLANATRCLADGADVYFSDCRLVDGSNTMLDVVAFSARGLIRDLGGGLYAYDGRGDFAPFHHLLVKGFFQTSSLVFRSAKFADLRFDTSFAISEDYLFFLSIFARRPQIRFSSATEVHCRTGVNIWASKTDDPAEAVKGTIFAVMLGERVRRDLELDPLAHEILRHKHDIVMRDGLFALRQTLRRGGIARALGHILTMRPRFLLEALAAIPRRLSHPSLHSLLTRLIEA